jgi:hypothetical protein
MVLPYVWQYTVCVPGTDSHTGDREKHAGIVLQEQKLASHILQLFSSRQDNTRIYIYIIRCTDQSDRIALIFCFILWAFTNDLQLNMLLPY